MINKPLIAITMGDPAGIGAEVTTKALLDKSIYEKCRPFIIGSQTAIADVLKSMDTPVSTNIVYDLEKIGTIPDSIDILDNNNLDTSEISYGILSATAGQASVNWILKAGILATSGEIQAVATAPINKEACNLAGYKDVGHMEIFQRQTGAQNVATMLIARKLRVVHLTTHRSLRLACDAVTKSNVFGKIKLTDTYFRRWGYKNPKIAVSALNPHASDGGLLGNEESTEIAPAINKARSMGINVVGPIPADTVFNYAIQEKYDVVIAMYHDQGHIPIKVHDWASSVSVNLGLPFIRTSVDHGTAFDIAGKGIADHTSMLESLKMAASLASEARLPY